VADVLYALLFLPAVVAAAWVLLVRRPRTVAFAVETNPFETIDAVLAKLETTTLDARGVDELEQLAAELESAAAQLKA
jgi:hypothetical protein